MNNKLVLRESIREKVASFPEHRMGAHKVAVLLADGRVFEDVIVAWEQEVISAGGKTEIPFTTDEIVDVFDRS